MKILVADTYYPAFLSQFYDQYSNLSLADYPSQLAELINACFGTSDFYSHHLNALGCEAQDVVLNCVALQKKWAQEQNLSISPLAMCIPHRMFRLPVLGRVLSSLPGLMDVAIAQIKLAKPDVLYCQDISFFPNEVLCEIRSYVRLIVGQIACPLPPHSFIKGYDLILTSFPHFVERLRGMGVKSEYFRIGFDDRVLSLLGDYEKNIPFGFVGGISRHHHGAVSLLEYLADKSSIEIYGYGVDRLPVSSSIRQLHQGEVWGMEMYRTLARNQITLNRHINVAENYANNMRLYEATGVGTMLLTDMKDNLHTLFDIGSEVVAYSSKEEAAELVNYYLSRPQQIEQIAKAGQARTLREHTYSQRMQELVPILKRYLANK